MGEIASPQVICGETHLRALHRDYFTASRLAALYGAGYTTRWQEYHVLRGSLEPPDVSGALIDRGRRLQPVAGDMLAEQRPGWQVENINLFWPHPTIARFGASPDQILRRPDRPDPGRGEVKVVNAATFAEDWCDGPPIHVALQHQAQLCCSGATWGVISALVIGTWEWRLVAFDQELRPRAAERIERDVIAFLADVDAGREPVPDFGADGSAIADLYRAADPDLPAIDLTADNRLSELVVQLQSARAAKREAEKAESAAKAEILAKLGRHERAFLAGGVAIEAPTQHRAGYVVEPTAFRTIRIKTASKTGTRRPTAAARAAAIAAQAPPEQGVPT